MSGLLDRIQKANDIKDIEPEYYYDLAYEIRRFLLKKISKTGGHVASNLGVVELTMALHLCLDFPKDKLIWDVGHQAYTHKILTGRKDGFDALRHYKGLSGFPKIEESNCDAFNTGHSSTSISAALGYAKARDILGEDYKVFAVIGDGALSGGMVFEALNNAANLKSNMVIVLNDNNMSISENVGGMANYLGQIRTGEGYTDLKVGVENALKKVPVIGDSVVQKVRSSKDVIKKIMIPGMFFEDMGLTYIGPIDGHDINKLIKAFNTASKAKEPVIVHVVTKKGKGYKYAEENPMKFHGIDSFVAGTGECTPKNRQPSYTEVFSNKLVELGKKDSSIVAITAAMQNGTGLSKFNKECPGRMFDVGIAEEHAVTFAAGLAAGGAKPIVAVYSTFLQRAYDQILHDVCLCRLPVVFMVDRAGIVGPDGATHQGIYDVSYMRTIPELTIMAPKNYIELGDMLEYALKLKAPVAIRYPKGTAYRGLEDKNEPLEYGKAEVLYENKQYDKKSVLIVALGSMVKVAEEVIEKLKEDNINYSFVNLRFAAPIDMDTIENMSKKHDIIVTMEENTFIGGVGEYIISKLDIAGIDIKKIPVALDTEFVEHGEKEFLLKMCGLDSETIYNRIVESWRKL